MQLPKPSEKGSAKELVNFLMNRYWLFNDALEAMRLPKTNKRRFFELLVEATAELSPQQRPTNPPPA